MLFRVPLIKVILDLAILQVYSVHAIQLYLYVFSKFRVLTSWKTDDLDYILNEGDSNFKRLGFTETPFVEQFPKIVFIEGQI